MRILPLHPQARPGRFATLRGEVFNKAQQQLRKPLSRIIPPLRTTASRISTRSLARPSSRTSGRRVAYRPDCRRHDGGQRDSAS
jgi:hypothetical protein